MSSPTLTTAVIVGGGTTSTMPRSSRAAPTPPARAVITGTLRSTARAAVGHPRQATRPRDGPARCRSARRRVVPDRRRGCARLTACRRSDQRPPRPDRLSVGFDATPLLGRPTGVGAFCAGALAGLAGRHDVDGVRLRRELAAPAGHRRRCARRGRVRAAAHAGPAAARRLGPRSPSRRSSGSSAATTWSTARTSSCRRPGRAARVVTVHDLTVVRFPELCDAADPRLSRPHPPGGGRGGVGPHPVAVRGRRGGRRVRRRPGAGAGRAPRRARLAPGRRRPTAPAGPRPRSPTGAAATSWPSAPSSPARTTPSSCRPSPRWPPTTPTSPWCRGRRRLGDRQRSPRRSTPSPVRARIVRPGYLDDAGAGADACGRPRCWPTRRVRGVRVPAAPGHGGRGAGGGHRRRSRARGGGRRGLAGRPGRPATPWPARLVRVLDGGPEVDALVARGRARSRPFTWEACAEGLAASTGTPAPAERSDAPGEVGRATVSCSLVEQLRRSAPGASAPTSSASSRASTPWTPSRTRPTLDAGWPAGRPGHRTTRPAGRPRVTAAHLAAARARC